MVKNADDAATREIIQLAMAQIEKQKYGKGFHEKHKYIYRFLEKFSDEYYKGTYSKQVGEAFLHELSGREKPITKEHFNTYTNAIQRLNHILQGNENWCPKSGKLKSYVSSCFDKVLMDYEAYLYGTGKMSHYVRSYVHIAARFLCFVESQGITSLLGLSSQCIYSAFQAATDSKGAFRKVISSFLRYAYRYSLTKTDFSKLMPSVKRRNPLPTVYDPDEIEMLLSSADRSTAQGKRNYAIMLIAARLGLRATDIANLTFTNVNFANDTINIVQVKTGHPLKLPLLPEIRNALLDYIDKARPQYDGQQIFIQDQRYRRGPLMPNYLYKIISTYFKKIPFDGKERSLGPRALRSSLATTLLDEGNDYSTIRQILGHKNP